MRIFKTELEAQEKGWVVTSPFIEDKTAIPTKRYKAIAEHEMGKWRQFFQTILVKVLTFITCGCILKERIQHWKTELEKKKIITEIYVGALVAEQPSKPTPSNSVSGLLTVPLASLALTTGTLGAVVPPVVDDICNLDRIYNESYQYSLPKKVLEGYLSGIAFDNHTAYTDDESQRLHADINEIYQQILSQNPSKEPIAIITAGAPGAGKTSLVIQIIERNKQKDNISAYVSPDDVCLDGQKRTFKAEIRNSDRSETARTNAYNKWRPGSNAASELILANLIREKFAFYFGITATHPKTYTLFEFIKKQGYKLKIIHVTAPDDVRWESVEKRKDTFIQSTEEDTREKGKLLPQRISDTYLKYADEIEFYFRAEAGKDALLAARWLKAPTPTVEVIAPELYQQIKTIHNTMAEALKRPDLYWESTVEKQ